jgi:hypothetical protein
MFKGYIIRWGFLSGEIKKMIGGHYLKDYSWRGIFLSANSSQRSMLFPSSF